jgi:aldose 1-epimerase
MGRYANRIGGGTFAIDGRQYELDRNQRGNTIHGGSRGFGSRLWSARPIHNGVEMKLVSADGDMGFPGTLAVTLRYVLHAERGRAWVDVRMSAKTTRATHVNFTNHAVFNLDGAGAGFGEQRLRVAASRFTPTGENGLPTGQVAPIAGQPFDLRQPAAIAGLPAAGTVDANMVLDNGGRFAPVAWIDAPASGRSMTLSTSEPGMQLFVPAKLPAAGGQAMGSGLCLEPQHFPDTPHNANFPATLLRPGKIWTWQTRYDFRFPDVRAAGRKT